MRKFLIHALNGSPGLLLLPRGERFMLCISSVTYLIQSARSQYILQRSYRPLPVPCGKLLWNAQKRDIWEQEYDYHLSTWHDGELQISELWLSPETGSAQRRKRIEKWVQSVDEFGMMLFAVCAHIHGC
jgi:hypothetical protein